MPPQSDSTLAKRNLFSNQNTLHRRSQSCHCDGSWIVIFRFSNSAPKFHSHNFISNADFYSVASSRQVIGTLKPDSWLVLIVNNNAGVYRCSDLCINNRRVHAEIILPIMRWTSETEWESLLSHEKWHDRWEVILSVLEETAASIFTRCRKTHEPFFITPLLGV